MDLQNEIKTLKKKDGDNEITLELRKQLDDLNHKLQEFADENEKLKLDHNQKKFRIRTTT